MRSTYLTLPLFRPLRLNLLYRQPNDGELAASHVAIQRDALPSLGRKSKVKRLQ